MKRAQLITIALGLVLTGGIYFGFRTVPKKKPVEKKDAQSMDDGQNQAATALTIDTFLTIAKRQLTAEQTARIMIEFEKDLIENPVDLVVVVGDARRHPF